MVLVVRNDLKMGKGECDVCDSVVFTLASLSLGKVAAQVSRSA